MRKLFCIVILICLMFVSGCSKSGMVTNLTANAQKDVSNAAVFVSGMGCNNTEWHHGKQHHGDKHH